jgi:hypothetical protein
VNASSAKRPTTLEIGGPDQNETLLEAPVPENYEGDDDEPPRVVNIGM